LLNDSWLISLINSVIYVDPKLKCIKKFIDFDLGIISFVMFFDGGVPVTILIDDLLLSDK
jgi:hypothetical protein